MTPGAGGAADQRHVPSTRIGTAIATNAAIAIAATLVTLLAAEGLTRLIGVPPEFGRLMPIHDSPTREVDGVVLWTREDARASEEDIQRAADDRAAFTILGLGDSILYGVGQRKEDTYLEQARRTLAARVSRRVDVLNLAVPGYNTVQENAVYKEIEDRIRPDLVLVHYWGDDVHQYRVVGGYVVDFGDVSADGRLVVRALPLPPALSDFLLVHSRFYDFLTHVVVARRRASFVDEWSHVTEPLAAIDERVRRAGGRLLVLDSPDLSGPVAKPTDDLGLLRTFAESRGIEVIDVSEWLRGVDTRQIAMDHCHFNAEGHRLLGEKLAAYLLAHDLKP